MSGISRRFRPRTYLGKLKVAHAEMKAFVATVSDPKLRDKTLRLIEKAEKKIAAASDAASGAKSNA